MGTLEHITAFSWHHEKYSNVISWHVFMGSWDFHGNFMSFSWTVPPVVLIAASKWQTYVNLLDVHY